MKSNFKSTTILLWNYRIHKKRTDLLIGLLDSWNITLYISPETKIHELTHKSHTHILTKILNAAKKRITETHRKRGQSDRNTRHLVISASCSDTYRKHSTHCVHIEPT